MLIYGIPNFKLEKEIVIRRTNRLSESGINFEMNCEIGSSTSFEKIQKKHEAILIATGVYKSREINLNHNNSKNISSETKDKIEKIIKKSSLRGMRPTILISA